MVTEGDIVRVSVDGEGQIDALEFVANGADIYGGSKFILPITQQTSSRTVSKEGATKGTSRSLVKEGEYHSTDRAEVMLYAGVSYKKTDSSMTVVLDYPTEGNLTESDFIGNLRTLTGISGAKVLAVNYTAFNSRKEKKVNFAREVEIDEVR